MKCYHCNENEAEHRFLVNYMGYIGEVYICSSCVEKFRRYTSAMYKKLQGSEQPEIIEESWSAPTESAQQSVVELRVDTYPAVADEDFKNRRKINELRIQLKKAVECENYERAAKLRDKIALSEKGVCAYDQ